MLFFITVCSVSLCFCAANLVQHSRAGIITALLHMVQSAYHYNFSIQTKILILKAPEIKMNKLFYHYHYLFIRRDISFLALHLKGILAINNDDCESLIFIGFTKRSSRSFIWSLHFLWLFISRLIKAFIKQL